MAKITRIPGNALPFAAAVGVGLVALFAAGCGGNASTAAGGPLDAPTSTSEPAVPESNEGGFGAPAAAQGEFDGLAGISMVGTADLDSDGCWYLSGNGESALLIVPVGTSLGDDGTSLVTPDGLVIEDGVQLDVIGGLVAFDDLPGGTDGRWGNYAAFCDPRYGLAAVADSVALAFDAADVDPGVLAEQLDASLFDTDYDCGYGFATGDREGRWALHIDLTTPTPSGAGTVTLPDDRFAVFVVAGAHLFANHCDDVMEWFEPTRTPSVTWEVTAGSFVYPEATNDICASEAATTTLVGASVDTPSGPVALDAVDITNAAFGCFAG